LQSVIIFSLNILQFLAISVYIGYIVIVISTVSVITVAGSRLLLPLSSDRQHLSYGGCLEVNNCSMLCCAQQYAQKYEQFLNSRLVRVRLVCACVLKV